MKTKKSLKKTPQVIERESNRGTGGCYFLNMVLKEGLLEREYLTSVLTKRRESVIPGSCRRVPP